MKHLKVFEDFLNEGAFHVALFKARNEGATEFEFKGQKFPVHPKKDAPEMIDEEKEKAVNEGASAFKIANAMAEKIFGEFGIATLNHDQISRIIDIEKADKLAKKYGETGFMALSELDMEELLDKNKHLIKSKVNEGAVKTFEMDVKTVIDQIKKGMGWIDPSYIEETWNELANSVDFSIAAEEVVNRLIKAGLVYHEGNDGEKGKQVRSYKEVSSLLESVNKGRGRGGLSKEETLKVAEIVAKAISKVDKAKVTVNKRTLEPDSFDLDFDGEEFAGGSYNIYDNGEVRNEALPGSPVYAMKDSTLDQAIALFKKNDWKNNQ